ncbi:hypothetical protein GC093_24550 [Paenibacillus sp. LMG 31456]|uniref:Copper amine oxidase-like N-terminal domain-containing protein n=1 Tax=Paenibacillus foliorum TaxID=2654974 RepID=A0A972H4V4_9BACL|nr:stalk domain-containing protein [Paenibacillus foliorum]NOU96361.1 hypothetical protein [Paenibacillus foliorum]
MVFVRGRFALISGMLLTLLFSLLSFVATPSVSAAVAPGDLLITELVSQSADDKGETGELYRYIQLYNNTDQPIDLSQQKIYYYYQVAEKPWETSKFDKIDITDRDKKIVGSDGKTKSKMYIQPHSIKVVWIYVPKDVIVNKTLDKFNAMYGTQLTDDDIVYSFHNGFAYTGQRYLAIVGPGGNKDTDRYSFIRFNGKAASKQCNDSKPDVCDFAKGESVKYFYPQNGLDPATREMEVKGADSVHQKPTPGKLAAGQVLGQPEIDQPTADQSAVSVNKKDESQAIILQIGNQSANVKGKDQKLEVAPVLDGDTTMVPFRFIGEALGATVVWGQSEQKVTLTLNDITVVLVIDSKEASIGGNKATLETAPKIIDGNTMVPLRFVSESLKQEVKYDAATKRITLSPLKP